MDSKRSCCELERERARESERDWERKKVLLRASEHRAWFADLILLLELSSSGIRTANCKVLVRAPWNSVSSWGSLHFKELCLLADSQVAQTRSSHLSSPRRHCCNPASKTYECRSQGHFESQGNSEVTSGRRKEIRWRVAIYFCCWHERISVCVCVRERERERERVCVNIHFAWECAAL